MRVELHPDHRLVADDLSDPLGQVRLAVLVVHRHHGAVQEQQHHVERPLSAQVRQQRVAKVLVDGGQGLAGGMSGGEQAFDERMAVARGEVAEG